MLSIQTKAAWADGDVDYPNWTVTLSIHVLKYHTVAHKYDRFAERSEEMHMKHYTQGSKHWDNIKLSFNSISP